MSSLWNLFVKKWKVHRKNKTALETMGRRCVSRNQALALMQCIEYLTQNISTLGLFITPGNPRHLFKILRKIEIGDVKLINYLTETSAPRECAIAFNRFIRSHKISILPERATKLLCASNDEIPRRLIALDVLNLIHHESDGIRLQLAKAYLQMMQQLTLRGYITPTEIRIAIGPYLAFPALFPGKNCMQHIAAKSGTLLELLLNVHLLDDAQMLSTELQEETSRLHRRQEEFANSSEN
ncbi:uncharacterized protein LOC129777334 [Toxorhynchites rutilus septentrionalis]|uniref:uncharacterized protein LOC129777334 n=1 Tax=Toxorhynchites rutilus septentrionalis TaxID=329112 RepID=UPI00247A6156|nr:uncharacterized protein LOC129777334 [Toxorhynchites rutilus septentrionalis]